MTPSFIIRPRSVFPYPSPRGLRGFAPVRKRGMGDGILPASWGSSVATLLPGWVYDTATRNLSVPTSTSSAVSFFVPGFIYNSITGDRTPAQIEAQDATDAAANLQAATNPVTGVVNTALLTQANAQAATEQRAAGAEAEARSTGSSVADLWDNLLANLFGVGSGGGSGTPGSGIDWTTIAVLAALGLGGYIVIKELL